MLDVQTPTAPVAELTDVRVYYNGNSLYQDMLADIERASRDICMEMYRLSDDRIGRKFHDALTSRARAGKRVRLIYDGLGCLQTPVHFFETLRSGGVEVIAFNPIRRVGALRHWRTLDRRNHRKLLVVDDRVAYLGGINIAEALAGWEDAHLRLEGSIVRTARNSFESVWANRYRKRALRPIPRRHLTKRRTVLLDGFPAPNLAPIKRAHLHLFAQARRRIRIAHAYLVPDRKFIRVLRRAVRRGVDVHVLVPTHSDVGTVDWARRHVLGKLLRSGVHVRRLDQPLLHSKSAIADEAYAIIGSANLNRASYFRNLEIALWSPDPRVVIPLAERFDTLWKSAENYTLAQHQRRGWHRRLYSSIVYRLQFILPVDQAW